VGVRASLYVGFRGQSVYVPSLNLGGGANEKARCTCVYAIICVWM
jgi:hypothetical protein